MNEFIMHNIFMKLTIKIDSVRDYDYGTASP